MTSFSPSSVDFRCHLGLYPDRSHSSHSSHSSHRSSTGGYSYISPAPSEPAPLYSEPSKPAPTYQAPAIAPAPLKTLPGNAYKFKEIVQEVQFALLAFGYYSGEIDGEMNPEP